MSVSSGEEKVGLSAPCLALNPIVMHTPPTHFDGWDIAEPHHPVIHSV